MFNFNKNFNLNFVPYLIFNSKNYFIRIVAGYLLKIHYYYYKCIVKLILDYLNYYYTHYLQQNIHLKFIQPIIKYHYSYLKIKFLKYNDHHIDKLYQYTDFLSNLILIVFIYQFTIKLLMILTL